MKTQENKQKAIELAYGEYWDRVKDFVDVNGWCSVRRKVNFEEITNKLGWQCKIGNQYSWRPKSLSGIETNNNWTVINSEEDLPKEENELYFVYGENVSVHQCIYHDGIKEQWLKSFTHWQNIIKPLKPIY